MTTITIGYIVIGSGCCQFMPTSLLSHSFVELVAQYDYPAKYAHECSGCILQAI